MQHTLYTLPVLAAALLAVSIDSPLVAQPQPPGGWANVAPGSGPAAREDHATAYDSERGVIILFGGRSSGYHGDTWEWDGVSWTQAATTGPSLRDSHAMAYDSQRRVTVLFGGTDNGALFGDTWEWDGNTWTQVASTGPSARYDHAMAYDSQRGVTVLFGGHSGDTWEWDGNTWSQVATSGPSARGYHAMAYDSQRGRTILFGGMDCEAQRLGDTWEWDGNTWTQPGSSGPTGRWGHAMAYDNQRGFTVLFGGRAGGNQFDDTWQWDGNTWHNMPFMGPGPSPRHHHAMAYDSLRGVTVLFGGDLALGVLGKRTWEMHVPVPAGVAMYGSGCGSPSLSFVPISAPELGSTATCVMAQVPAPYLGAVALGFSNSSVNGLPLPFELSQFGLPGCFQLTSEEANPLPVTAGVIPGVLQFQLTIPNDPSWLSIKLYLQSYCLAPGANALGAITSNGIEWTIGHP